MNDISRPTEAGAPDWRADDHPPRRRLGRRGRILSWVLGLSAMILLALFAWSLAHPAASGQGGGRRHGGGGGGGAGGNGSGGPGGAGGAGAAPTTVATAVASAADLPVTVEALGTVTPAATVTIVPQVSGTITQLRYREGQIVHKGETLAIIDPRPYQAILSQAQGALLRDRALLDNAQTLLRRDQLLLTQDSIARQDVDTQASLVRQYQGTVVADEGSVQQAAINVGYTKVSAPVGGRVGLKVVDVGNYIGAGTSTGIAVVTTLQPIDVEFAIPQDQAPAIQKRVREGAVIPAIALDRTRTTTLDTGRFSTLNNQVDTTTGTIKGKARFANAALQLYPSQFVNVRLTVDTVRGAVTVPPSAVRSGPNGSFVWLLGAGRTVSQRTVTTGVQTADLVQILSGLALGDMAITDGGDRLTAGATVRLPCDKAPPAFPRKRPGLFSGLFGGGGSHGAGRHRHAQESATAAGGPACPGQRQGGGPAAARTAPHAAAPDAAMSEPAAVRAAPGGSCPNPPSGLDRDARHAWFQQHMAGLSDDRRAACRAERQQRRAEHGGGGRDGGSGG